MQIGPEGTGRDLMFLPINTDVMMNRPVVTVSSLAVNQLCVACPPQTTSRSRSPSFLPTNCSCVAGFSGPDGGGCAECPAGSFKNGAGPEPCA
eukprot:307165-Rhodomonas_salina.1